MGKFETFRQICGQRKLQEDFDKCDIHVHTLTTLHYDSQQQIIFLKLSN